jgi:tripartite-type tricarboxylate transporter receptor subunit TctC
VRARVHWMIALCGVLLGICAAGAQDYPNRYIRVIAGPGPDIVPRIVGPLMSDVLKQQFVVEPRPGAGGTIAAQSVKSSESDGYTLLLASASYTINTATQQSPFDLSRDFTPVGLVGTSPFVLVVHPSVPVRNLSELIAYAKANPGKLNYASAGVGTPPHLAGELFKSMTGVDIVHVPFREANSAINAVLGGSVEMMFAIASTAMSQIESGKLRGIAVTTLHPTPLVPGVPAVAEAGIPGFEVIGWNGFVAPLGTPDQVVAALSAALNKALDAPDLRDKLSVVGYEPAVHNTPQQFQQFIKADTDKWVNVVAKTDMKAR